MSNSSGIHTTGIGGIRIGTELNQTYKIDSLIGVGGMGEVFQGHNIQTGDPVAIKVVLPEFARDDMILEERKRGSGANDATPMLQSLSDEEKLPAAE